MLNTDLPLLKKLISSVLGTSTLVLMFLGSEGTIALEQMLRNLGCLQERADRIVNKVIQKDDSRVLVRCVLQC